MNVLEEMKRPSKKERLAAMASYDALAAQLEQIKSENPIVEIEETEEKIKVPAKALKLLAQILKATAEGNPISIVPIATEMTTQAAAELLGCSRPHIVKLVDSGQIPHTMVGRHRRLMFEDVMKYKKEMKEKQKKLIIEMMKEDEDSGLYDK
jgi:excisionase family DNA binding protein